jgi:hypothetical protein
MPIARGARKDVPKSVSPLPRAPVVAPSPPPRFVTGSIARHILVMTGTGAVGLMAIFVSDFATLFFLDLLGDLQLLAAVGYAGAIMFIMFSAGLGMAIAVASLVSPALGAGDFARARRLSTHAAVFTAGGMTLLVAALWPMLPTVIKDAMPTKIAFFVLPFDQRDIDFEEYTCEGFDPTEIEFACRSAGLWR